MLKAITLGTVVIAAQFNPLDNIKPDFRCVLGVETTSGLICVKSDGSVDVPSGAALDALSREFWDGVAKLYPLIKQEKCI